MNEEPITIEGYRRAMAIAHTLTISSVQMGFLLDRIDRASHAVRKLAGWSGNDISDLIEDGLIEEGDLS